jgi:ATP-binding cassette subfamily B protein
VFAEYCAVVQAGPDLVVSRDPVAITKLGRGVELRDVWFRYSEDQPWVLRGVNLFIAHGTAVAVAGRNGAGKSTLVKLLCRFYDPDRGAILWDGVDLSDLDPAQLRRRIGALFQDYMHYDLSASENIGLGDFERLTDQPGIEAAARQAGIHDTISRLPRAYATYLTRIFADPLDETKQAGGVLLSGGQWQRVALARALFRRDCDLLILDEPSSGLDAVAEREVQLAVRSHRQGATSVLISHRMASLRDADLIVVLSDGRVAESGTHLELMNFGGEYAQLFTAQATGYREDLQAIG